MLTLVLDGTGGGGHLALVEGTSVREAACPGRGGGERLAALLRNLLDAAGRSIAALDLIAAMVGPGSFTGLRATLALAQGIAFGAELPLLGVTNGEALRRTCRDRQERDPDRDPGAMPLWCVGMARRDRVFIERDAGEGAFAVMLDAVPIPGHPVLLAGDAEAVVAARIASGGGIARCAGIERPDARAIAALAADRLAGLLAPLPALPLYVDPAQALLPAGGLRPAPV